MAAQLSEELPLSQSWKDTRASLAGKYISIILTNQYLDTPFPIKCLSCGFSVAYVNNVPQSVITMEVKAKDASRSTDHRCKKCKITYRIY